MFDIKCYRTDCAILLQASLQILVPDGTSKCNLCRFKVFHQNLTKQHYVDSEMTHVAKKVKTNYVYCLSHFRLMIRGSSVQTCLGNINW